MRCTYLRVPLAASHGAGIICASGEGGVVLGVFHSVSQGRELVRRYGLPAAELMEDIASGSYVGGAAPPAFEVPYPASAWLQEILLAVPDTADYGWAARPRVCAFTTFRHGTNRCGLAGFYDGGPCHVVTFHSQEQADEVLDMFPHIDRSSALNSAPIATLYGRLPESSSLQPGHLTGPGAAAFCAAIEAAYEISTLMRGFAA